ncbi:MAG: hypothetical protein WA085_13030 [Sphingobium sp.]
MAMKLKFKVQPYQTLAVDAVVDCFAGQPFASGPTYRIDPGKRNQAEAFDDEGFRNTDFALTEAQLLENCQSACKRDPLSARKRDPLSRWRKVDRTRAFALRAA